MLITQNSKIQRIILSAGHGATDEEKKYIRYVDHGAVRYDQYGRLETTESKEVNQILGLVASKLIAYKIPIVVLPDYTYNRAIREVNALYKQGDWAIELHKDSFSKFNYTTMNDRMGAYYFRNSSFGKILAESMLKEWIEMGANKTSWAKPDNASGHGSIGWCTMTKPVAHIIEMGFLQDDNSDVSDRMFANYVVEGIIAAIKQTNV